jgi:hypothetical protein
MAIVPLPPEEIENFFVLYLKERYPELDLRRGTAIRDLVLAPLAELFAATITKVWTFDKLFRGELPLDDETYQKFIETLGKNFLVERKYGERASGTVRVYVAKKKTYKVPAGTKFYISDNLYLIAPEEYVFLPEELNFNALEGSWFFDVAVVAPEVGSQYNTPAGTKVEPEPFDGFVLSAEVVQDITGGEDVETIEAYLQRVQKSLTTRTLVSPRAIQTTLLETFDDLLVVTSVGFGDPEMWRDWKEFFGVYAHTGGHVDIWLKYKTKPIITQLTPDANGIIRYPGILKVLDAEVVETDKNTSFSALSWVKVNTTSPVTVLVEPRVEVVHSYVRNSGQRVLTDDLLPRVKMPATISGVVEVAIPSFDLEAIQQQVNDWIWNYTRVDRFEVSDLINYLYQLGATYVKPPTLTAEIIGPDYQPRVVEFGDTLELWDKEISPRTVGYIGNITLTLRG